MPISVDRGEQSARELLTAVARSGTELHTSRPVVAQLWRASSRQALLAKFLSACTVRRSTPGPESGQLRTVRSTTRVRRGQMAAMIHTGSQAPPVQIVMMKWNAWSGDRL